MKQSFFSIALLILAATACAQTTFNSGWHTYKIATEIRAYNYTYDYQDSVRLSLYDSSQTFSSPDSLVIMQLDYSLRNKAIYKTVNYLNKYKQLVKTEQYNGNVLESVSEWKYDNKGRKISYSIHDIHKDSRITNTYDYQPDNAGIVITENAYYNGKIEFYTQDYYDKKSVRYKEVRLNDNKKDVVHIETYKYDKDGRLRERTVFFPEFRVTKHFTEPGGDGNCFKQINEGNEKIFSPTKEAFIKRKLLKYQKLLKSCNEASYKLNINKNLCQLKIDIDKNSKTVSLKIKEL